MRSYLLTRVALATPPATSASSDELPSEGDLPELSD